MTAEAARAGSGSDTGRTAWFARHCAHHLFLGGDTAIFGAPDVIPGKLGALGLRGAKVRNAFVLRAP